MLGTRLPFSRHPDPGSGSNTRLDLRIEDAGRCALHVESRTKSGMTALLGGLAPLALLGGCNTVVLHPNGDVALQQGNLVIFATVLMLVIVVPVIALVCLFAWRYRASNEEATYSPDWDHSTQLELLIWAAPLLIIICLGAVTWTGSHLLDPYRPIERLAKGRPVDPKVKPLEVQVVALDWKWLFIYPEYNIATINELAAPVDRPIRFRITASSVMNAFYVPTLAGMIYAMPSMETKLHAVINKPGDYAGFSSNYSGAGFSGMRFRFHALDNTGFAAWITQNKASKLGLSRGNYLKLEKPTEKVPVIRFAAVAPGLFDAVVNQCVRPGTTCMSAMMKMDKGDTAGMTHMPNSGTPERQRAESPLTTSGAGGPAPTNPADIKQRSPSAPDESRTPQHKPL